MFGTLSLTGAYIVNWSFQLSSEERHLAKIGDLDSLEQIAVNSGDEMDIADAYERIFEALDQRTKTSTETTLDWGQRYIAWANRFTERDGLPFLSSGWAKRLFERSMSVNRTDIARLVVSAILRSYAPTEKEQRWWMKQNHVLLLSSQTDNQV